MRYSKGNPLRITLIGLAGMVLLTGCGPFYGIFVDWWMPKPKVKAEYNMSEKKVLIWVDDFSSGGRSAMLRRELTLALQEELIKHNAVGSVVDYDKVIHLRYQNPKLAKVSIQQIGQKLEAQEVLYVMIDKFTLHHEAGEGYYQGSIGGVCKIIDSETGKQQWPAGQTHRAFNVTESVTTGKGETFEEQQVRQVCREAVEKIAPNFYKHKK